MNVDNRLLGCASLVTEGGRVCDVGTDHAYLVAYLLKTGKSKSGIASDINDGPLEAASHTLADFIVSGAAKVIKSDGLEGIPPEGITDVVIAGMGAELICGILSDTEWIKNGVNLILQPMTRAPLLRKWLYGNGFFIKEEKTVKSDKFIYVIIRALYCGNICSLSESDSIAGMQDLSDSTAREYALRQISRLEKEASGIRKSSIDSKRANELEKIADEIKYKLEGYI